MLYVDQPVGTGFSDGSVSANNNEEVTQDFYRWLTAFYKEFPRLASLDTYLMGESYAGIYVCFAGYIDSHSMPWQAHEDIKSDYSVYLLTIFRFHISLEPFSPIETPLTLTLNLLA